MTKALRKKAWRVVALIDRLNELAELKLTFMNHALPKRRDILVKRVDAKIKKLKKKIAKYHKKLLK